MIHVKRMSFVVMSVTVGSVLVCSTVFAADKPRLAAALDPLVKAHRGQVGVAVKHLLTEEAYMHRADVPMPTASMIKLPVMIEAYRQVAVGKTRLSDKLTLHEEDKVPGSGILTPHFSPGTEITLRDAVRLMIAYSDNTATNLVLDRLQLQSVNQTMQRMGFPKTRMHSKVFRRKTSIDPQGSRKFGLGATTATETLRLYEMLHRGELVSEDASRAMLEHLRSGSERVKLARLLPRDAGIAHKGGSVSSARCDAGIVQTPGGPVAVCVLTSQNEDKSWDDDNAAELLCARIGRVVWDLFDEPDSGQVQRPSVLALGATGELVEALQRTLNARLKPSPRLAVDGDFGAMTEQAVMRLQRARSLTPNGIVDSKTWKLLGPLLTTASPVPAPETVNTAQLKREPADSIDGPPLVTCRSWLIADARTGDVLWSHQPDRVLDMASTTKIMTAVLVLQAAKQQADVLDEVVVFSRKADQTPGSTAGIRAGERISVRELLYGLLLPSGNDAAVALAEHFGPRLSPKAKTEPANGPSPGNSVDRFVTAMNRMARELNMDNTTFRNPHGLTADGHASTARDLAVLARAALRYPLFGRYVSSRQRGCRVESVDGYQRNLAWKNTNRLLGIEGYAGIKTGTTSAAGACLVSQARRDGRELILVVLGSRSSAARYTDTRNLYRWAWRSLEQGVPAGK